MTKASITQLLHKRVSIRRSGKIVRDVLAQSLVDEIKQGRLKGDDEISADEKNWVKLNQHCQLASFFSSELTPSSKTILPKIDQRLTELSEMLKDLNQ